MPVSKKEFQMEHCEEIEYETDNDDTDDEGPSEYEKLRAQKIAENEAMFKELFPVPPSLMLRPKRERQSSGQISKPKRVRESPRSSPYPAYPTRRNPSRNCRRRRRVTYGSDGDDGEDGEKRSSDNEHYDGDGDDDEFQPGSMIVDLWGNRRNKNFYSPPQKQRSSPKKAMIDRDDLLRTYSSLTEDDLVMVADRVNEKNYDQVEGSTCHQCRQKTDDLKTLCRSPSCFGTRGQFCGPCLKNRYGEDAKKAVMNANWVCPPCRGICNCSICRHRKGKRATGCLIKIARERGYDSVKSFLGD